MVVLNIAFVTFTNASKFFKRIESIGAKNEVAQSAINWAIAKNPSGAPFTTPLYPQDVAQFRKIGISSPVSVVNYVAPATPGPGFYTVTIGEIGNLASVTPVLLPVNITIPQTRN